MKRAYHEKILNNFEAIKKRTQILEDIVDGRRPQNAQQAKKMLKEINHTLESTKSIIDLVPTQ